MASPLWNEGDRLATLNAFLMALTEQPYRFDFFQTLRTLEQLYPNKPRLGESQQPNYDGIRLGQKPSSLFAPSTLAECRLNKSINEENIEQQLAYLNVYFFGLFGTNGPLPLHLTEFAHSRSHNLRDETMIDFLNIFHHRFLSLFYRAWANKEPTVHYDRPDSDRFHTYVGALFGIGSPALKNNDEMPDNAKLHFAGHFSTSQHHACGLVSILKAFFNVPVSIQEYIGEWLRIPKENQTRLGQNKDSGLLGQSTVLGQTNWQQQYKFRLLIGAMPLTDYEALFPKKPKLFLLASIIKNYIGHELNWEVQLILKKEERPQAKLGEYGQLGLSTWISNQAAEHDINDLTLFAENIKH
ncbi:MAG: type VI secretion system baseplate subunit TssG [bacterium]